MLPAQPSSAAAPLSGLVRRPSASATPVAASLAMGEFLLAGVGAVAIAFVAISGLRRAQGGAWRRGPFATVRMKRVTTSDKDEAADDLESELQPSQVDSQSSRPTNLSSGLASEGRLLAELRPAGLDTPATGSPKAKQSRKHHGKSHEKRLAPPSTQRIAAVARSQRGGLDLVL